VNPKTGRKECVFANLELVYPSGDAESGYEFCFEELRAMKRGLIDPTGRIVKPKKQKVVGQQMESRPITPPGQEVSPKNTKTSSVRKLDIFHDTETSKVPVKMPIFEDSELPQTSKVPLKISVFEDSEVPQPKADAAAKAARKARREEKANRTRKIAIMEVKAEPQTSKCLAMESFK
jgi:checkpoint serine/threonine-protein kinase